MVCNVKVNLLYSNLTMCRCLLTSFNCMSANNFFNYFTKPIQRSKRQQVNNTLYEEGIRYTFKPTAKPILLLKG